MVQASVIALFPPRSLWDGELRSFFQRPQPLKVSIPFSGLAPAGVCNHVHHEELSEGWEVVRCTNPAILTTNGLLCRPHQDDCITPKRRVSYRDPAVESSIISMDGFHIHHTKLKNVGTRK